MVELIFISEDNLKRQQVAAEVYRWLWQTYGERIITAYEKVAGFNFPANNLKAIIHNKTSQSHPLKFQAHEGEREKLGDMMHELGHIVIVDGPTRRFDFPGDNSDVRAHKVLDLILYDVMVMVMGKEFANWEVEREKKFSPSYLAAWSWALAMSREDRQNIFTSLLK